jgi:hypothetical protein
MFRESLELAKEKFTAAAAGSGRRRLLGSSDEQDMRTKLVTETLAAYGTVGIYDPSKLADIDFINKPEQLVSLVERSRHRESRALKPDMQLLTEVTMKWMQLNVAKKFPPLTPHHTQAFVVLMMSKFFQLSLDQPLGKGGKKPKPPKFKSFIAQVSTGEGKSIVIAMLCIFMVRLYGLRVHVLENNESLMLRDYNDNKPFYDMFDMKSGTDLADPDAKIVYCLKSSIQKRFLQRLVEGKLDEELGQTVLIVDEVDDLIVNERPNSHYVKRDDEKTPALAKCYDTLKGGGEDLPKPEGVPEDTWEWAKQVAAYADTQATAGKDYQVMEGSNGKKYVRQLDGQGNVPKVSLTSPWHVYLNYKLCGVAPVTETRHACVCTPYIFNKYKGIFGLTGSIGGKAELNYLTKTYKALKFDVPRFLDTCSGNARKEVINHGVEILADQEAVITRVGELAAQFFHKVPVLIITTGGKQMNEVLKHLRSGVGGIPKDEVQRFAQFDERGRTLAGQWQGIIDDATRRLGGTETNRCRVTVTDKFGGRGHDFQVMDKETIANGGMLVIATSIPDEREWIQWKGRTARQDKPGQFYVILDQTAKPFSEPKHKSLASKLRALASNPPKDGTPAATAMVEQLLDVADEGIGDRLKKFEGEQATGEKLNEMTELYYKCFPRSFDDPWPQQKTLETDSKLRRLLSDFTEAKPAEVKQLAKQDLNIDLD